MDTDTKQITIILAEDDPTISMAYTRGLTYHGFRIVPARDGTEALDAIDREAPDLLLLDVIMPNMNGIEVLEALKKRPDLESLPVIVITNLGQPTDADRVQELGARSYLIKANLSLQELVSHINEALKLTD